MAKRKEETVTKKKKKSRKIQRHGFDASGAGEFVPGIGNIKRKMKEEDRSKTRKSKRIAEERKEDGFEVSIDQLEEKIEIHAGGDCEVSMMQDEAAAMERSLCEPKKLKKNKGGKVHGMQKEEKIQDKKLNKKKRKENDATKEGENMQGKKRKEKKTKEVNMCEEGGRIEADFDDVLYMSSGDEDCSKGMKKWVTEYYQRIPGLEVLNQRTDEFLIQQDKKLEEEREVREARAAEGGWTVVTHLKGRKKNVETETGTAVGSVSQAVVEEYLSNKKPKELKDFYRFQKREAQRNEILTLQSKFEQDKKRIQQLRAARKFRPY